MKKIILLISCFLSLTQVVFAQENQSKDSWGVFEYYGGTLGDNTKFEGDEGQFVEITNGSVFGASIFSEVGKNLEILGFETNFGLRFDYSQFQDVIEIIDEEFHEKDKNLNVFMGAIELRTDQGPLNPYLLAGVGWARLPVFGDPDVLSITGGGGVEYKLVTRKKIEVVIRAEYLATYVDFEDGFFVSQLREGVGIRWNR